MNELLSLRKKLVRERDSMKQTRIKVSELPIKLNQFFADGFKEK